MKKIIVLLSIIVTFSFCSSKKNITQINLKNDFYLIKKIEKINSWYVIYAKRNDTLYKIVTKEEAILDKECNKIIVGKKYDLILKSHRESAPIINGIKLAPVGYTGCYNFDKETVVCLEPNKGIYDLFYTSDLKGLCYLKKP